MAYRVEPKGRMLSFQVPSFKLKRPDGEGKTMEMRVHDFLLQEYGGYTVTSATVCGYWLDESGKPAYNENKEYKVATGDKEERLHRFLADLARDLEETAIVLDRGGECLFLYP